MRAAEGALRVGLLLADEDEVPQLPPNIALRRIGPAADLEGVARMLFAWLRELDTAGVDDIYIRPFAQHGAGLAIHDRLRRAAVIIYGD